MLNLLRAAAVLSSLALVAILTHPATTCGVLGPVCP